jgi:hypothetical protein
MMMMMMMMMIIIIIIIIIIISRSSVYTHFLYVTFDGHNLKTSHSLDASPCL